MVETQGKLDFGQISTNRFAPRARRTSPTLRLIRRLIVAFLCCSVIFIGFQLTGIDQVSAIANKTFRKEDKSITQKLEDAVDESLDTVKSSGSQDLSESEGKEDNNAKTSVDSAPAGGADILTDQVTPALSQPKIGKITMLYGGPNPLYERALALHEPHNMEHGYRMQILREPLLEKLWSKPAYVEAKLLEELAKPSDERLEWFFWVDADVVLMNPHIPLELFLPPSSDPRFSEIRLLVTNDHRGLNDGVFYIKVDQWSVKLMADVIAMTHYMPDVKLQFTEQSAMGILIEKSPEFANHTIHLPQRWINPFTGYRHNGINNPPVKYKANSVLEGDLLVHFAGGKRTRVERMTAWMDIAEQHLDQWELAVDQTRLPKEIEEFWTGDAIKQLDEVENVTSNIAIATNPSTSRSSNIETSSSATESTYQEASASKGR